MMNYKNISGRLNLNKAKGIEVLLIGLMYIIIMHNNNYCHSKKFNEIC